MRQEMPRKLSIAAVCTRPRLNRRDIFRARNGFPREVKHCLRQRVMSFSTWKVHGIWVLFWSEVDARSCTVQGTMDIAKSLLFSRDHEGYVGKGDHDVSSSWDTFPKTFSGFFKHFPSLLFNFSPKNVKFHDWNVDDCHLLYWRDVSWFWANSGLFFEDFWNWSRNIECCPKTPINNLSWNGRIDTQKNHLSFWHLKIF